MLTVAAGLAVHAGVPLGPVNVSADAEDSCYGPKRSEAEGQVRPLGGLQPPSPQPSSAGFAGKRNSKSLVFCLLLEEVLVEDELPGGLCQGNAA